jgi:transcriptional regulator ATRX
MRIFQFQNNLSEYYAMVQWIKPNFLGTINEFNNIYANPIKDGQTKDSTTAAIKKMKQKSFILNNILSKFVQRKEASVLKEFLPEKHEYVLSVPLTELQEKLYEQFIKENPCESGRSLLPDYTALRKIWTHPRVLQYAYERAKRGENKFNLQQQQQLQQQQLQQQQQQQQQALQAQNNKNSKNFIEEGEDENPDDVYDTSQGKMAVTNNWWSNMVTNDDFLSINSSNKTIVIFEILKRCEELGEKVLIFTAFVAVLDVIELFMKAINDQDSNPLARFYGYDRFKTTWKEGSDYFRLDGSTPRLLRHKMIQEFNKPNNPRLRCFLISAKAGGQGINLIGANRCIIVDTSWVCKFPHCYLNILIVIFIFFRIPQMISKIFSGFIDWVKKEHATFIVLSHLAQWRKKFTRDLSRSNQ